MVRRLMKAGHECVVYDRDPKNVEKLVSEGATGATSLADMAAKLREPRAAWCMVPSGDATEGTVMEDRKSTRLNSSHANISYAVFCLKKKKKKHKQNNI